MTKYIDVFGPIPVVRYSSRARLAGTLPPMTPTPTPALFHPQGTAKQQQIVHDALDRCTFPFEWLAVGLHADTGRERIPVDWQDLTRYHQPDTAGAAYQPTRMHDTTTAGGEKAHVLEARGRVLGLAWYSGKVTLDLSLEADPELAGEVFLSEAAHMVDFFWMADRHRAAVWNALHPPHQHVNPDQAVEDGVDLGHGHGWFDVAGYAAWVGEALMGVFVAAFSDFKVTMLFPDHPVTPRAAAAVRAAFIPDEPEPLQWVGAKRSTVYHHPGCWIVPAIINPLQLGWTPPADRRPCRLCKPDQAVGGIRRGSRAHL